MFNILKFHQLLSNNQNKLKKNLKDFKLCEYEEKERRAFT